MVNGFVSAKLRVTKCIPEFQPTPTHGICRLTGGPPFDTADPLCLDPTSTRGFACGTAHLSPAVHDCWQVGHSRVKNCFGVGKIAAACRVVFLNAACVRRVMH